MALQYRRFCGADIESVFDALAQLRIAVFRAYPYLYEGTVEYERNYLKTYAAAPRSMLFAVYDAGRMVGATTCLPLSDETEEVQAPFHAAGIDAERVFYFGESVLLPKYRGRGIGHLFFDVREAHAASFGDYDLTCFCAVNRPAGHPSQPAGYRPLDEFWASRGYRREPKLQSVFSWPDLGETASTPKTMTYWVRPLPG